MVRPQQHHALHIRSIQWCSFDEAFFPFIAFSLIVSFWQLRRCLQHLSASSSSSTSTQQLIFFLLSSHLFITAVHFHRSTSSCCLLLFMLVPSLRALLSGQAFSRCKPSACHSKSSLWTPVSLQYNLFLLQLYAVCSPRCERYFMLCTLPAASSFLYATFFWFISSSCSISSLSES